MVAISLAALECLAATWPRPSQARGAFAAGVSDGHLEFSKDKGYRFERGGWIYVHLEGTPYDIGYQHGYLLATEIADAFVTLRLEMTHDTGRDWGIQRLLRAARLLRAVAERADAYAGSVPPSGRP